LSDASFFGGMHGLFDILPRGKSEVVPRLAAGLDFTRVGPFFWLDHLWTLRTRRRLSPLRSPTFGPLQVRPHSDAILLTVMFENNLLISPCCYLNWMNGEATWADQRREQVTFCLIAGVPCCSCENSRSCIILWFPNMRLVVPFNNFEESTSEL
jgi:hypothetical protein